MGEWILLKFVKDLVLLEQHTVPSTHKFTFARESIVSHVRAQ